MALRRRWVRRLYDGRPPRFPAADGAASLLWLDQASAYWQTAPTSAYFDTPGVAETQKLHLSFVSCLCGLAHVCTLLELSARSLRMSRVHAGRPLEKPALSSPESLTCVFCTVGMHYKMTQVGKFVHTLSYRIRQASLAHRLGRETGPIRVFLAGPLWQHVPWGPPEAITRSVTGAPRRQLLTSSANNKILVLLRSGARRRVSFPQRVRGPGTDTAGSAGACVCCLMSRFLH